MADIILATLAWLGVAFIYIDIPRQRCVKGTRRRYIYATIQWALVPPTFLYYPLDAIFDQDPLIIDVLQLVNFAFSLWILRTLLKDDDDNWWKRKRKQLKRYLRSIRLRQPSLAGARI